MGFNCNKNDEIYEVDDMNISLLKRKWMLLRLFTLSSDAQHAEYVRKHNLFYAMGKNCYWHPYNISMEAI